MKNIPNMNAMLKQAQKMQKQMMEIQEELENMQIEGSSAGGMVKVGVNGKGDIKSLKIDPQVVNPEDVEILEDMILAAINDGVEKSRKVSERKLSALTGGFPPMGFQD
jgi:DNA-binding YbaB/EbfC family protein